MKFRFGRLELHEKEQARIHKQALTIKKPEDEALDDEEFHEKERERLAMEKRAKIARGDFHEFRNLPTAQEFDDSLANWDK